MIPMISNALDIMTCFLIQLELVDEHAAKASEDNTPNKNFIC